MKHRGQEKLPQTLATLCRSARRGSKGFSCCSSTKNVRKKNLKYEHAPVPPVHPPPNPDTRCSPSSPRPPGHKLGTLGPAGEEEGFDLLPLAAYSLRVRCSAGGPNLQKSSLGGGLCPHFHTDILLCSPLLSSALYDRAPPSKLHHDTLLCNTGASFERSLKQASGRGIPAKALLRGRGFGILSMIMLDYEHVLHPSPLSPSKVLQIPTFHHRSFRERRHPFPASESENAGERGSAGTKVAK